MCAFVEKKEEERPEKLASKVLLHPMLTNEKSFIGDDIARKFITIIPTLRYNDLTISTNKI